MTEATYRLVLDPVSGLGIACLNCQHTSHHPSDVANRYCRGCRRLHRPSGLGPLPSPLEEEARRLAAALGLFGAQVRQGLESLAQWARCDTSGLSACEAAQALQDHLAARLPEIDDRRVEGTTIEEITRKWKRKGAESSGL